MWEAGGAGRRESQAGVGASDGWRGGRSLLCCWAGHGARGVRCSFHASEKPGWIGSSSRGLGCGSGWGWGGGGGGGSEGWASSGRAGAANSSLSSWSSEETAGAGGGGDGGEAGEPGVRAAAAATALKADEAALGGEEALGGEAALEDDFGGDFPEEGEPRSRGGEFCGLFSRRSRPAVEPGARETCESPRVERGEVRFALLTLAASY
jgi:hypothetical protein